MLEKTMKTITVTELHEAMKAQGMEPYREDIAFVCPMCKTVQSMRSLMDAGVKPEEVEKFIGFSCEGRFRNAPPAKNGKPGNKHIRGCDWTLGGLFKLHTTEVVKEDGSTHPIFELANQYEAKQLLREITRFP
jgi:hypothetical protein